MRTQLKKAKTKKTSNIDEKKLFTFMIIYDFAGLKVKGNMSTSLFVQQTLKDLDRQLKQIIKLNFNAEILLCVGLEADLVINHIQNKYKNFNIRIVENKEFDSNNSCESLRLLLNNAVNDKIIICDHFASINKTILSKMNEEKVYAVVSKSKENCSLIGANISKDKRIEYFSFGACQEWRNLFGLFNKCDINKIKSTLFSRRYRKKFVFELMNDIIETNNIQIKAIEVK